MSWQEGLLLHAALEELVSGTFSYEPNRRLAGHILNHSIEWFWFLIDPTIDATNYRGEQAMRPAVVNRKVWGGNRTWVGGMAQRVLMSLARTLVQRGQERPPMVLATPPLHNSTHPARCGTAAYQAHIAGRGTVNNSTIRLITGFSRFGFLVFGVRLAVFFRATLPHDGVAMSCGCLACWRGSETERKQFFTAKDLGMVHVGIKGRD